MDVFIFLRQLHRIRLCQGFDRLQNASYGVGAFGAMEEEDLLAVFDELWFSCFDDACGAGIARLDFSKKRFHMNSLMYLSDREGPFLDLLSSLPVGVFVTSLGSKICAALSSSKKHALMSRASPRAAISSGVSASFHPSQCCLANCRYGNHMENLLYIGAPFVVVRAKK